MWLLKLHEHQEFEDFKISENLSTLRGYVKEYVEEIYGHSSISFVLMGEDCFQICERDNEIGFIGKVEII